MLAISAPLAASIFDAVPAALLVVRDDGGRPFVAAANPAARNIFGADAGARAGVGVDLPAGVVAAIDEAIAALRAKVAPTVGFDVEWSRSGSAARMFAVRAAFLDAEHVVMLVDDASERASLARELAAARAELLAASARHADELEREMRNRARAERDLQGVEAQLWQAQKMEAVARLASGVAHDFNNLLSVMSINAELGRQSPADDVAVELFAEIASAAERGAALTKQLLTFSRHEPSAQTVVDVASVVRHLEPLLRRLLGERTILRIDDAARSPPVVLADRSQLEQVVMNLAVNAKDAMGEAGTLTIAIRDDERHRVVVFVIDTGCGMSADTASRAFEPFFTTKKAGKGTGLGLATTYGIVKRCGGDIRIDSKVGVGTTISFSLPRATAAPVGRDPSPRPKRGLPRTAAILLLEDDPLVRHGLARLLRRAGHQVFEASTLAEARTVLQAHSDLGLIVADVTLPDGTSLAFVREMVEGGRQLRALFTSGYTETAIRFASAERAGLHFLQKPATPDVVLSRLVDVLDDATLTTDMFD